MENLRCYRGLRRGGGLGNSSNMPLDLTKWLKHTIEFDEMAQIYP